MSSPNAQSEGSEKLLSTSEVAERLSVNVKTLATWRHRGGGPDFMKLGGLVRYPASDLEAFIQASRRSAA